MSALQLPKYAIPEIERRWLVDPKALGPLDEAPRWIVEDLYLAGTRLRLRAMIDPAGGTIHKLGKKYGRGEALGEPITNLYLSESEHALLLRLPGARSRKRRYHIAGGSLDVYERPGASAGIAVFEREFELEAVARAYVPPGFVTREITGDPAYSGAALAGA